MLFLTNQLLHSISSYGKHRQFILKADGTIIDQYYLVNYLHTVKMQLIESFIRKRLVACYAI